MKERLAELDAEFDRNVAETVVHLRKVINRRYDSEEEALDKLFGSVDEPRGFILRCIAVSGDDAKTLWRKYMSDIDKDELAKDEARMLQRIREGLPDSSL